VPSSAGGQVPLEHAVEPAAVAPPEVWDATLGDHIAPEGDGKRGDDDGGGQCWTEHADAPRQW
jgi:hypothetical protein